MRVLIIILIAIGLALEELGVVAQRGAQLVTLDKKMTLIGCIWGLFSFASVAIGYYGGKWILSGDIGNRETFWIHVMAGVFLAVAGIHMLIHAVRAENIFEHRMERIDFRHDVILGLRFCVYGFFCGLTCGLLEFTFPVVALSFFLLSLAFTMIGYVCGREFGPCVSRKAYAIGGSLLCVLGLVLQVAVI